MKHFGRVPTNVMESAMRKIGFPDALVRAVISLCTGSKAKVKVGTHLSEEFEMNVGVHEGSVLSPLLFVIVIDVSTNAIKYCMLQEIFYAEDLELIAETMAELQKFFLLLETCN